MSIFASIMKLSLTIWNVIYQWFLVVLKLYFCISNKRKDSLNFEAEEKCKFDLIEPSVWLLSDTDHGCLSKGGWCSGWRQSRSNQTFHVMEVLQPTLIKCQPVICYLLNIWWSCCYLHIMLPKRCCLGSTFWILLQKKKNFAGAPPVIFCKIPENGEGQTLQPTSISHRIVVSVSFVKREKTKLECKCEHAQ